MKTTFLGMSTPEFKKTWQEYLFLIKCFSICSVLPKDRHSAFGCSHQIKGHHRKMREFKRILKSSGVKDHRKKKKKQTPSPSPPRVFAISHLDEKNATVFCTHRNEKALR